MDLQIFNGDDSDPRVANMQGFVKSYFQQQRDVKHASKIMYYFIPDKLRVLTTLATEFAVFNGWFASIPGPTICNRAFAHYGTSFGKVGMDLFYVKEPFKSIYDRTVRQPSPHLQALLLRSGALHYGNRESAARVGAVWHLFIADCGKGTLPDYSFKKQNSDYRCANRPIFISRPKAKRRGIHFATLNVASGTDLPVLFCTERALVGRRSQGDNKCSRKDARLPTNTRLCLIRTIPTLR
jgi:hypothetical protein